MKTIESLSTQELENWIKGTAPAGNIAELEKAAVEYACRVELYGRNGGCNSADRPTHEAELHLADKEEEINGLEDEVEEAREEARAAERNLTKAEDELEKAEIRITELKDNLQVAATKIDELKSKLIGKE